MNQAGRPKMDAPLLFNAGFEGFFRK